MGRRYLAVWLAALYAPAALPGSQANQFVGTWQARHNGTVICTIKVAGRNRLSAAFYGCSITVNQAGDLIAPDSPRNPPGASPLGNLTLQNGSLFFEQQGAGDLMKFELVLTGTGQADLRFLESPVRINPIHFERKT